MQRRTFLKGAAPIPYKAARQGPVMHLNWESLSQPVEHIPTTFLYPD
jgi:hypothetical protein